MRPTLRAILLFTATIPIALILMIWRSSYWLISFDFGLFLLLCIALDAAFASKAKYLTVHFEVPSSIPIGAKNFAVMNLTVGRSARSTHFEALAEQAGPLEQAEIFSFKTNDEGLAKVIMPLHPIRRGQISLDALWLRWQGLLGLAERTMRIPIEKTIDVTPDVPGIQSAALNFFSQDAINGVKVQLQKGDGVEFESLREHIAGLDNRFIDWKRSAKHRKLLSKEFRSERNHQIVLAYDTGHLMLEPINGLSRLDHAINAGLLLSWISLRSGDLVGSFGFDARVRQYMQPSRGMPWFTRLQRGTGQLNYHTEETNFTLGLAELNMRLKRRALVVLFTDFIDTTTAELLIQSLQRMSNHHAIVFVTLRDPLLNAIADAAPENFRAVAKSVVAQDFIRERSIVLERLERLGVHCLDVSVNQLAVGLINRYLAVKERGLI